MNKRKILAGIPFKKQRAARDLPDVWGKVSAYEKCEPYFADNDILRSFLLDWKATRIKGYRYSFNEFAIDALLKCPNAYKIEFDYYGGRTFMMQGDLLAKRWEKRDGLWYDVPIDTNLDIFYGVPQESPKLAHYLNF